MTYFTDEYLEDSEYNKVLENRNYKTKKDKESFEILRNIKRKAWRTVSPSKVRQAAGSLLYNFV